MLFILATDLVLASSAFADDVVMLRVACRNAVNDLQITRYPMSYNGGE